MNMLIRVDKGDGSVERVCAQKDKAAEVIRVAKHLGSHKFDVLRRLPAGEQVETSFAFYRFEPVKEN